MELGKMTAGWEDGSVLRSRTVVVRKGVSETKLAGGMEEGVSGTNMIGKKAGTTEKREA